MASIRSIIKYLIGGVVQRWAMVVAKQGRIYLIRAPLVDQPNAIYCFTAFAA